MARKGGFLKHSKWATTAMEAIGRRLSSRGFVVSPSKQRVDEARTLFICNVLWDELLIAKLIIQSSSKRRMATLRTDNRSLTMSAGRFSRRSPNVRKFAAIAAKRLKERVYEKVLVEAKRVHDS